MSCRKGNLRSRHDRRTVSTRPKRKSKFVTCAERPPSKRQRAKVHAKKKKQVCDVCGASTKQTSESKSTRQKEKASLRRVRSVHQANVREQQYPPKRKSKFVTCAERPPCHLQRTKAPAKKKKQVCDVCGAPSKQTPENKSTRQKEKASLRRVRSAQQANVREQKHLPKKMSPIRGDFDIIYE